MAKELNKYSKNVTQDPTQPASQAMLHAIGLSKEDLKKPMIGIGSTGYEGNPCNMHLNDLAKEVKFGVQKANLTGLIFNTIGVSDGISMGTFGMRYSLPSRDIIADSMETVVQAMNYDGLVTIVGCDKNMPGALSSNPSPSSFWLVRKSTCATAPIEAIASPLNPLVVSWNKSSADLILEVACLKKQCRASSSSIPEPLSLTLILVFPDPKSDKVIFVAPASTLFSNNSLTTEAGL
jgi:hypothetical protein